MCIVSIVSFPVTGALASTWADAKCLLQVPARHLSLQLPFGDDRVDAMTLAHLHPVAPQRSLEVYQDLVHQSEKDGLRRRVGGG